MISNECITCSKEGLMFQYNHLARSALVVLLRTNISQNLLTYCKLCRLQEIDPKVAEKHRRALIQQSERWHIKLLLQFMTFRGRCIGLANQQPCILITIVVILFVKHDSYTEARSVDSLKLKTSKRHSGNVLSKFELHSQREFH